MSILENLSNSDNSLIGFAKKTFAKITNPGTLKNCKKASGRKVYLLLTPQYNNLGDHAIALSALQLLNKVYTGIDIIEITSNFYKNCKEDFMKHVTSDDLLFIIGGGFMGDMWTNLENLTRDIVLTFPDNHIIFLPQTIFYTDEKNIEEARRIYSAHKKLTALLRDEASYNLSKNKLGIEKVYYVPDLVTNISLNIPEKERQNIAVCLREDCEKTDDNIDFDMVRNIAEKDFDCAATPVSTLIKKPFISPAKRENYVLAKINQISRHKILITNRLHAMLFAYVSKTPCLAFDNKSKKVSGTLKWLPECTYIKMYSPDKELSCQISDLVNISRSNISCESITVKNAFVEVEKILRQL